MKFVKVILITLAAFALIGAGIWQFVLKDQIALGTVGAAYVAKQVCSCRFVSEREMDSCMTDFTPEVSENLAQLNVSESYIDATGRTDQSISVSGPAGLISEKAVFEPGLGCVLQEH